MHQQIVIDENKNEKYIKVRLQNVKIETIKVYKDNNLAQFEIIQKKKKGKDSKEETKEINQDEGTIEEVKQQVGLK